jgi:hypothetical protein
MAGRCLELSFQGAGCDQKVGGDGQRDFFGTNVVRYSRGAQQT